MVEDIRRNARRSGNDSGLCLGRPAYQNGYVELERQKNVCKPSSVIRLPPAVLPTNVDSQH